MAFRFRREGDRIKHRMPQDAMGMQAWIGDFKWRAQDWQYEWQMKEFAKKAMKKTPVPYNII